MAWISVHESIVGPKLRDLRKKLKCSQWEAEGILCSLWLWGLTNAAKDGFLPCTGREDIAADLSGTSAGSKLATDDIVDALIETGWIDEGNDGLSLHDWDVWQEQWYKAKAKREYDAKRKREIRKKQDEAADEPVEIAPPPAEPAPKEEPAAAPLADTKYSKSFEEFWEAYPRHDEKAGAYKCYKARLKDGFSEDEILFAAKCYAMRCQREHTERKYIKQAKTFLGPSTPFTDFLPSRQPAKLAPDTENPFSGFGEG